MEFRLVAYNRLGSFRGVLPVPLEFTPVDTLDELPTLQVHYPRNAVNSPLLDNDPEVAVEYQIDGKTWIEPRNSRFRVQKVDQDYLDKVPTTRYDFIGIGEGLRGQLVYGAYGLPLNDEGKVQFKIVTPGAILNTVWYNATTRGWTGYTKNHGSTTDSMGSVWPTTFTVSYDVTTSMANILQSLVNQGQVDYWWQGRQMNMVKFANPAAYTDHSVLANGVRFVGTGDSAGIDSAPEAVTHGGLATHVIVIGENGLRWEFPTAVTLPEGRRDVILEFGGVDDAATAEMMAAPYILKAQNALKNTTRQFHLTPNTKILPHVHYKVGDWVNVQRSTGIERMRIIAISITTNQHGTQGYVTLGDKVDEWLDKLYKRVQSMNGGVSNEGGGTPPSPSVRKPNPATGLTVGEEPYIDSDGYTQSAITASWTHDGKDIYGDVLDIQDYWFFFRVPGAANWTLLFKTPNPSGTYSPLPATKPDGSAAVYEFAVETHSTKGVWSNLSNIVTKTMRSDTTPPLIPTAPTVSTWLKTVTIGWDGLGKSLDGLSNLAMPKDFAYCRLWESTVSDMATKTEVGQFTNKGLISLGTRTAGTTYWYALSAVDRTGNETVLSAKVSVTPQSVVQNAEIDAAIDQINEDIGANVDATAAAQEAADQALDDAEAANLAAIAAAATAAGKSDVVYQPNAPAPSSNTLWIDTDDGNKAKVWTGVLGDAPRTNISTNPDFYGSSGTVIVKRNEVLNPRASATTTYWNASPGGGAANVSRVTTGNPIDNGSFIRYTQTTASASGSAGPYYRDTTAATPGTTGDTRYFNMWVRPSVTRLIRISGSFKDNATADVTVASGTIISCPANVWTQLPTLALTATGDYVKLQIWAVTATAIGVNETIDTVAWIDRWDHEFIDGDTPDDLDYDYAWSGTTYGSISTGSLRTVTGCSNSAGTTGVTLAGRSLIDVPPGGRGSYITRWQIASTGGSAGSIYQSNVAGVASDRIVAKLWVKFNVARTIRFLIRPRNGTTIVCVDNPVTYDIPANTWTEIVGEVTATGPYTNVQLWPWHAGGLFAVNDIAGIGKGLIEVTSKPLAQVGPFFTGDFLGCSWTGTVHASTSNYAGPAWVLSQDAGIAAAQAQADTALANAATAQAAATAAANAASAAQTTADGKTTVSVNAPTTGDLTGKPANALWTQVVAGKVVGAWYKATAGASSWTSMPFDPVMIPVINIGTGTFGDLDGLRMKLKSLSVDKLLVSDQNSYIENGNFETGDLSGWVASGWSSTTTTPYRDLYCAFASGPGDTLTNNYPVLLSGVVGKETEHRVKFQAKSGTAGTKLDIAIYALDGTTLMTNIGQATLTTSYAEYAINLKTVAGGWGKVRFTTTSTNGSTASVYLDQVTMYRRDNGELIIDGSILANMIKSREIKADHLEAGLILSSEIIAGDPLGTHARMNTTGFHVYAADPVNPANPPREVIRMGVGGSNNDYLGIVKPDGQLGASIDENGTVSADKMFVGNGGMYYKGRELRVLLDETSLGLVAWGQFNGNQMPGSSATNGPIPNGVELGLFELAWEPVGTRMYAVSCSPVLFTPNGGVATAACFRVRYTTDGSQPTTTSAILAEDYKPILVNGAWTMSFQMSDRMIGGFNGSYIRVLFTIACSNGNGLWTELGQSPTFMVKDLGPAYPKNGVLSTQISSGGGGSQTVKVTRTESFVSTSSQSYDGSLAKYNFDNTHMYQGLSPSGYGNLRSLCLFNPGNQWWDGRLTGATINFMRLYFYFPHWYYNAGGTAYVGVHGGFSGTLPNTWSHSTGIMFQPNWPKPGGYWLDIPSTYWANIANGTYRGFSLYGDGTFGTYGYADRPTLQIGYTK